MLQKSVLWLLILVMLVKTSVLPCAAMSEPQPSMMSTATSVQLLTSESAHQHCADYAVEITEAVGEHAAPLADTEHSQTGTHYCYSCHSCGAAAAMMVASELWHASLYTDQSAYFRLPKPPLVWLASPERPPKLVQQA